MADSVTPPFVLNAPRPLHEAPSPAVERAKVQELSQEFEAMLMLQMVRQMRQSLLDESEEPEGFGGSTMRDTFDTEFSRYLAQSGGIGLGGYLARALDARTSERVTPGDAAGSAVPISAPAHALDAVRGGLAVSPAASPGGAIGRSTDNTDAPASAGLPLANGITSSFGWRPDPLTGQSRFHRGVDLRAAYGTDVPAAAAGTVVFAGERGTYGNLVVVRHENGVETRYAHLSATAVRDGERVEAGTPIGRVGSTGRSAAPHLHFEVLVNGERVDPADWAGRVGRGPLKSDAEAVD